MDIISQWRSSRFKIIWILVISAFLISLIALLRFWKGVPISSLTRDINAVAGVPFYIGFFSQIGIFFWVASVSICLFSARILSKRKKNSPFRNFLFFSGLLTLLLALDDIFLLHEEVFPDYLGVPEKVVFASYGVLVLFLLVKFYKTILRTDFIVLAMAFFFFGFSVISDFLTIPGLNQFLVEDSAKMVGIVSWFFYFHGCAESAIGAVEERS